MIVLVLTVLNLVFLYQRINQLSSSLDKYVVRMPGRQKWLRIMSYNDSGITGVENLCPATRECGRL